MLGWDKEARGALRSAAYLGDGADAVAALAGQDPGPVLQFAGDGILAALAQGVPGAEDLARKTVAMLRDRGWWGDGGLVAQLAAALGEAPTPLLRPVPVDLEEVEMCLEGDPSMQSGGYLDLETGDVVPRFESWGDTDQDGEDFEDDSRWLWIECEGSSDGYEDMVSFVETVTDERLRELLDVAISGRGAFRRFGDVVFERSGEAERWHAFSDERRRGRARSWLAGKGLRPAVRGRSGSGAE